jgi:hypothetical protein
VPSLRTPTTSTPSRRSRSRTSPATRQSSGGSALDAVERRDHGAPGPAPGHRRRRAHLVLRLQRVLYEVGFNHFFRGKDHPGGGDQIYFQGHASPGIYARAFLEGRLSASARRLPPGALARASAGAVVLPAPAADAGLLGVPDGVDGARPDERDLPGAVQPVPAPPRHQGHQPAARVGLPRRRRDGRAGVASALGSSPPARSWTTSRSSSTATCSASTGRSAATARSSRSWRRSSAAPAGTSSR